MSARAIASFCIATASLLAGLAVPVAFPDAPSWAGFIGLGLSLALFVLGMFFTVRERRQDRRAQGLPPLSDAPADTHSAILRRLIPPLARALQLAMAYGTRDLAGFAEARAEAQRLIAQIPHDRGTSQTAKDFLQACSILMDDTATPAEQREGRSDVHRMSIGLFRFLHDGKPVDRTQVEFPEWCAD